MPRWLLVLLAIILIIAVYQNPAGAGDTIHVWFSDFLTFVKNL